MNDEQHARLSDIRTGPWRARSELARQRLPTLSEHELERYLRSHFGDKINDPTEIEFRESFDQALEELQLLELAVACSFLPLDVIRTAAEAEFATLLFSKPARAYVRIYDFVPVRYLAYRLGIDLGTGQVQSPPINPEAEVRYATFLATHYEFVADPQIRTFTKFIDDFYFGQRQIGAEFLRQQLSENQVALNSEEQELVSKACLGFIQFTETLGDFFIQVPVRDRGYFGLAYSYWLGHFFGFRGASGGYRQLGVSFEDVQFNRALFVPELDSEGAEAERKRFNDRVRTLKAVWDSTCQLMKEVS